MLSKSTTDQINKEADDFGFQVPYDGTENFYDKGRVEGYQAGATAWAVWKEKADGVKEVLEELLKYKQPTHLVEKATKALEQFK